MSRLVVAGVFACAGALGASFACTGQDPAPEIRPPAGDASADAAPADAADDPCADVCDLVRNQAAREIAVDDTHVYWTTTDTVARASKTEVNAAVETLGGGIGVRGLSLAPAYVFWATTDSCAEIHRLTLATSEEKKVSARIGGPSQTRYAAGQLFYAGDALPSACLDVDGGAGLGGGIHVLDESLADAGVVPYGPHACETEATALLDVDPKAEDLVWMLTPPGDLCWLRGGTSQFDASRAWSAVSLTRAGDHVYVGTESDGVLDVARVDGGPVTTRRFGEKATGMVFDAARGRLFLVTEAGVVHALDGSTATTIAETGCRSPAIAQDADALYLTCANAGTIKRVRKPAR